MKKLFTLLTMLIVAIGTSWAIDVTDTFSSVVYRNADKETTKAMGANVGISSLTLSGDATINSSSFQVASNATGGFTVTTPTGFAIKTITFKERSSNKVSGLTCSDGGTSKITGPTSKAYTYTSTTTINSVTFTWSGNSGNAQINEIVVTMTNDDIISGLYEKITPTGSVENDAIPFSSSLGDDKVITSLTQFNGAKSGSGSINTIGNGKGFTLTTDKAIKEVYFTWIQRSPTQDSDWGGYTPSSTTAVGAAIGTHSYTANKWTAPDENTKSVTFKRNVGNSASVASIHVIYYPAGPTITTQPQSASYVTGDPIAALTVAATPNTATYQWYTCDDANRTNAQAIPNETSASYTPTGAGFYYVAVTAGTTINSDVAQITVSEASAPTSATIESTSSSAEIGANVTLSITAMDGTPTPTEFKWYSCADTDKTGATEIEGETGNTYTFSKNAAETYYFFANVKNSQGNVDSNVLSVTITKKSAGLAYATTAVEKNIGAAKFTNALTNPNNLTVAYSVEDGATATGVSVNESTGEVTVGNVAGTATIKASFAGNDEYLAGNATYTLTVVTPDPVVEAANVNIAKTATGGNIAFTVGYHSAHNGELTAATAADWITLGDVTIDTYGAGTVAFTNDANPGFASRFANVTLTYTYNTNETKTTTLVVAQEANIVGTSIIKVPVQDATHAGTITGSIGGTATVALQTSAAAVDGGYKFGQNGNNITITLADSKTFQEGDIFIVHTTKAADTNPGILSMYSGDNMVLNTGTKGILGVNAFALPAAANDKTTIAVKRVNNTDYNWNGYVDYIEVVRPNATIELNDGGSSFTKGFSTFCASANYTLTGATAYAATISDSKLIMTAIEGVIPANEGVVIVGDKNADVTINYTTEAATTVTDNDLKGTTVAAKTADLKGTAAKFLAFKKSTSTFTPYGGENFPANKAYLLLDSNNDSYSLEMVFEEATGINNVNAAETEAQAAPVKVIKNGKLYIGNYNVAGQQVK